MDDLRRVSGQLRAWGARLAPGPVRPRWRRSSLALAVLMLVIAAAAALLTVPGPPDLSRCRQDLAGLPPPPPGPDGRPANYLHTCGSRMYDAHGREVRIAGINWFGMETGTYAPHGLWARNWRELLDQIAALGYNTIRLPFSNEALEPTSVASGIDPNLNPDLEGITGLALMDKIIAGARERGLKVVLDRHRPTAAGQTPLWYSEDVPEDRWTADWRMLARRYLGNDTVIGVDLHNEPREAATWGTGDRATDWRLAAERAGNAVLAENPYLLVFVQGVERYGDDWYWWGGNLQGVRTAPVRLEVPYRVVYSPHDYGPGVFEQGWFRDARFPANLPAVWDRHWGYIHRSGIAPVVVGEFGGWLTGNPREQQWHQALLDYLLAHRIGSLNWALNPNASDTGGILDGDWLSVVQEKQRLYVPLLAPPIGVDAGAAFGKAPARLKVLFRQVETAERASNISFSFRIANDGPHPIDLGRLEVRYWFTEDARSASGQEVVVDWAEPGAEHVRAEVVAAEQGGQDAYLRVRFDRKAGTAPPYRNGGEVQVRLHRSDWTPYLQTNDFSFAGPLAPARLSEWDRVTLYLDGKLVWGNEPAG